MGLFSVDLSKISSKITSDNFFSAIKLFIEKPHVVNRRICGFELKWVGIRRTRVNVEEICTELSSVLQDGKLCKGSASKFDSATKVLHHHGFETDSIEVTDLEEIPWTWFSTLFDKNFCAALIRNIIPKNIDTQNSLIEVVIIDCCCNRFLFVAEIPLQLPKVLPECSYAISLNRERILLETFTHEVERSSTHKWLTDQFLPTVTKWAGQMEGADYVNVTSSLRLVNLQSYNRTYQQLKRKYKEFLLKIWNETTDPLKFIHEDIAIAAYLIVLWEQERNDKLLKEKQSFLDLGCGNGLLVYLLSSEGHPGMGIDIKRRKLWHQFPKYVCLKEDVILPSDNHLYPNCDWLIGNHSDELTPWLPVIAAKSSMTSRFFVIPCCAHDFHSKFQRKKSGVSQYAEYLDYIEQVGNVCGFEVWKDRLRIPSTKRTCFVGQNRTYDSAKWNEVANQISEFVRGRCSGVCIEKDNQVLRSKKSSRETWCEEFKAKEPIQKVRNCTQLKSEVRDKLVNEIGFLLLSQENFITVKTGDEFVEWNRGGKLSMKNLADVLKFQLKHLKNECGGLQTLLRNHKFIFEVEGGHILLRIPESVEKRNVPAELLRTKRCWFSRHHPQGCVLKKEECTYLH